MTPIASDLRQAARLSLRRDAAALARELPCHDRVRHDYLRSIEQEAPPSLPMVLSGLAAVTSPPTVSELAVITEAAAVAAQIMGDDMNTTTAMILGN